jgi:hypothetical protein
MSVLQSTTFAFWERMCSVNAHAVPRMTTMEVPPKSPVGELFLHSQALGRLVCRLHFCVMYK